MTLIEREVLEEVMLYLEQREREFAYTGGKRGPVFDNALKILQEALAQPQQEPMPWKHDCAALLINGVELWVDHCPHCGKPRTSPPARKPLTDDQIYMHCPNWLSQEQCKAWVRRIEAAHGIKETR